MGPNTESWGTPDNTGAGWANTIDDTFLSTGGYHFGYHNTPAYTLVLDVAPYRKPWQSP